MTYDETRSRYRIYVASAVLSLVVGLWLFAFIFIKALYYSLNPNSGLLYSLQSNLKDLIDQLYGNWAVIRWTFDFVPDIASRGPLAFLSPAGLVILFLIYSPALFALPNARKLKARMNDIDEFIRRQQMLASRGFSENRQSMGNVSGGRDVNLNQEITNHFGHPPDSPVKATLTAIVGAIISAIVGFILTNIFGK